MQGGVISGRIRFYVTLKELPISHQTENESVRLEMTKRWHVTRTPRLVDPNWLFAVVEHLSIQIFTTVTHHLTARRAAALHRTSPALCSPRHHTVLGAGVECGVEAVGLAQGITDTRLSARNAGTPRIQVAVVAATWALWVQKKRQDPPVIPPVRPRHALEGRLEEGTSIHPVLHKPVTRTGKDRTRHLHRHRVRSSGTQQLSLRAHRQRRRRTILFSGVTCRFSKSYHKMERLLGQRGRQEDVALSCTRAY